MKLMSCVFVLALLVSGCGDSSPTAPSANVPFSTVDLRVGISPEANVGSRVNVNYNGWLYDSAGTDKKGSWFFNDTFSSKIYPRSLHGALPSSAGLRARPA